jgi:hypothetical protein
VNPVENNLPFVAFTYFYNNLPAVGFSLKISWQLFLAAENKVSFCGAIIFGSIFDS